MEQVKLGTSIQLRLDELEPGLFVEPRRRDRSALVAEASSQLRQIGHDPARDWIKLRGTECWRRIRPQVDVPQLESRPLNICTCSDNHKAKVVSR